MPTTDVLDTLLRLGKQIGEAVKADDWSLVSELVDRRSEAVQQLRDGQEEGESFPSGNREKIEALAAQNQSLAELLRSRRNEIEKELAQIGDLKHAQHSYEENSIQGSVLPPELTG
jgi:hypothetical protein